MRAIVDSGASKSDWVFLSADQRIDAQSIGLSPFYVNAQDIQQELISRLSNDVRSSTHEIYFYGAGCSSEVRNAIVRDGLKKAFPNAATIEVQHDLLGAARAACHSDAGIVSILGTGSNSCVYDGKTIIDNIPALGFFLGDEGSGAAIGRALLSARGYREMPDEIQAAFDAQFNYDREIMLHNVYYEPLPSRYVASFAPFCATHRAHPFVQDLLDSVFDAFVSRHLAKYKRTDLQCHFIGSIAEVYRQELEIVLSRHQLKLGRIVRKPIEELVVYHQR